MTQLPGYGNCLWPIDTACCDSWDDLDPNVQERSLALATATLRRLTGFRISMCTVKVRPCRKWWGERFLNWRNFDGYFGFTPFVNEAGLWVNGLCGCAYDDCSCTSMCEVELPGPVGTVSEVKVDGTVIDPANYRIDRGRLVWAGSDPCPWPTCQNLALADTEVGTFSVTYVQGSDPDGLAAYAVGVLACEYAKACSGAKGCRLPTGVVNVVRQGVSYEIVPGSFPSGFTGIREVDAFIALWNPKGRTHGSTVWSPDLPSPRYSS